MAEHISRYEHVGTFFNQQDMLVIGHDQIGHGKTGETHHSLGHIPPGSWDALIDDVQIIINFIRRDYKDTPIILCGHSMGSYIAQGYMQKYGQDLEIQA